MGRATVALGCVVAGICSAVAPFAQSQAPAFEVASVRLVTGDTLQMTNQMTDRRVDITYPMREILVRAFRMSSRRLVTPELPDALVDIQATIPAGSTVSQVPEMLQTLLTERFGLVTHRELRPMDAFELVVGADGMKIREVEPVNDLRKDFGTREGSNEQVTDRLIATAEGTVRTIASANKVVTITSRALYERTSTPSGSVINATRMGMAELVEILGMNFGQLVIDNTGLKGVYQFTLELPRSPTEQRVREAFERIASGAPGPSVAPGGVPVRVVETLGLKLEKRRLPIEVVVVDKILRAPREN